MGQLLQIGGHWIDPNRVITVGPKGGENPNNEFFIHVNMEGWTASYSLEQDEAFGWTVDRAAEAINEWRT